MNSSDRLNKPSGKPGYFDSYDMILKLEEMELEEKIDLLKEGITKDELSRFKEITDLDWITLGKLLNIAIRTLHLRKGDEKFSPGVCDRILAIAEVYSAGYNVYEDRPLFNAWMKRKNDYLLGHAPVEFMQTLVGINEVHKEIRRIEFGMS